MKKPYVAFFLALSPLVVCAGSGTNQITGRLGLPVGTRVEIEGKRVVSFKGHGLDVTALNGKTLVPAVRISVSNLAHPFNTDTNTTCRFRGCETTFVVTNIFDKTGSFPLQQAAAGRHFEFEVEEVLSPDTVKLRKPKVRTTTSTNIRRSARGLTKP